MARRLALDQLGQLIGPVAQRPLRLAHKLRKCLNRRHLVFNLRGRKGIVLERRQIIRLLNPAMHYRKGRAFCALSLLDPARALE